MLGIFWPENYSSSFFRQVSDTCIFYKSGVKNNRTKKSSQYIKYPPTGTDLTKFSTSSLKNAVKIENLVSSSVKSSSPFVIYLVIPDPLVQGSYLYFHFFADLPNFMQISLYTATLILILNAFPPFFSKFDKLDCQKNGPFNLTDLTFRRPLLRLEVVVNPEVNGIVF